MYIGIHQNMEILIKLCYFEINQFWEENESYE